MSVQKKRVVYIAAFLTPIVLFSVIMLVRRIVPFGDSTLLLHDAEGQYISFFAALRRILLREADALYTLSRDLGGSMAGIMAYYLASPLNGILVLLPETNIIEAFEIIVLIKIGFCGLCMAIYLINSKGLDSTVLLFSTAYALMGFVACYFWDIMWLDGAVMLPLIAWGIERLVSRRGNRMYVLSLALALFSNYYIGYMLCLFAVIYYLYVWLERRRETAFGSTMIRFVSASVLGAGLAGIMLVPAFFAVMKGYGLPETDILSLERRFPMIELLTKLLTGSVDYDQIRTNGLPALYIGIPVLTLTGMFFFNSSICLQRRIAAALVLLLFAYSFQNSTLYLLWHAFDAPNGMPGRFSFLCSFWMIVLAAEGQKKLIHLSRDILIKRLCWLAAGAFGVGCIVFREELPPYLANTTVVFDAVCMLGSCMLIGMLVSASVAKRRLAVAGLCVLQAVCLLLNGYFSIRRLEVIDQFRADAFRQELKVKKPLFDKWSSQDGVYRIETNAERNANDPLMYGYAGLSHYSSDMQNGMAVFFRKLGLCQSHFRFEYGNGLTPVAESLLGIRYILWDPQKSLASVPYSGYKPVEKTEGITVYENTQALPLAVMVSSRQTYDPLSNDNPFVNQNALLSDWVGKEWIEALENVEEVECTIDGDTMHAAFPASEDQDCYFVSSGTWFSWNGGAYQAQERLKSCVPLPAQNAAFTLDAYIGSSNEPPRFYLSRLNTGVFDQAIEVLEKRACQVNSPTDSVFQMQASASEEASQLLMTLPYDEGWHAWVDGKRHETCSRYGTLLAVDLQPGEHEVELRYIPKGLPLGMAISALASVISLALWLRGKKILKRP